MPGISKLKSKEDKLARLVKWYDDWESSTSDRNIEAQIDRNYYDGEQWDPESAAELQKRGQAPVVINRVQPKVDGVLGYEISTRTNTKAHPRTPAHEEEVQAVEDGIRYVLDSQKFDTTKSDVSENVLIEGTGGVVVEIDNTKKDLPIVIRHFPWEQFFYDPRSKKADYSDAKYVGLWLWVDREDALYDPRYSDAKEAINNAVNQANVEGEDEDYSESGLSVGTWGDSKRDRLKIVEVYWHEYGRWHVAHYTKSGFLIEPKPTGYLSDPRDKKSDECPLRATSAYVSRKRERYGIVKAMRDIQDEINKRRSKLIYQLSVQQVLAEEGAVDDVQSSKTELARPDGWVTISADYLAQGRFSVRDGSQAAAGQIQLLQEAKSEIEQVGPSATPSMASDASGRAIQMASEGGQMLLSKIFERLSAWQLDISEQVWHRIQQFKTGSWWVRVRDDEHRKGWRFTQLNRNVTRGERFIELMEEGSDIPAALNGARFPSDKIHAIVNQAEAMAMQIQEQAQQAGQELPPDFADQQLMQAVLSMPDAQESITMNNVAEMDMDIILDTSPNIATIQQEESAKLMDLVRSGVLNALGPKMLATMVIKASQLRDKRDILSMLEGQDKPDPNAEAIAQLQQQMQQMQLQVMQAQAQLQQAMAAESAADAELSRAKATKTMAEAQTVEAEAEAEIRKNQANAAKLAAEAGEKASRIPADVTVIS